MPHVGYVDSCEYQEYCACLPVHSERQRLTYALVKSCGWFSPGLLVEYPPKAATKADLISFHDESYIQVLEKEEKATEQEREAYNLVDDCYIFPHVYQYCLHVAGASITAANLLLTKQVDIAINWGGGRHHASRSKASGFCYINDVVLSVETLQKGEFERVLVIDIDIHHGDGTEAAFYSSSNVFTVSFHKVSAGFFPGTGQAKCVGQGKGRYTNLNVPLADGIGDEEFFHVVSSIINPLEQVFEPDVIVLVCGVDTLGRDPLGTFNLTSQGISDILKLVMNFEVPILLLGGGGYHSIDAAKCFTTLTATAMKQKVPVQVPEHDYFPKYGPDFQMNIQPVVHRPSQNTPESLQLVIDRALRQIDRYETAIIHQF